MASKAKPTRQTPTPRYRVTHSATGIGWIVWGRDELWCYGLTRHRARIICRALNASAKKGQ